MLKLKKAAYLFFSVVFVLIAALSFSACNNDGFEIVQSITYVTGREKKTETSQVGILTDNWKLTISENQYLEIDEEYRYTYNIPMYINLTKDKKTVTSYYGLTEDDIGETVGYYISEYYGTVSNIHEKRTYFSFTFHGWSYDYIRVKIIDNTTIVVRKYTVDTTYTVTSFQITYFDEDR